MEKTQSKSFFKNLFILAIPISLQNLITFAVGFADNVMVGSLGENAVSGVYMGNQMQTVLQMFIAGIEGGILILATQYWGKKDAASIRKVVSIGIKLAMAVGIIFSFVAVCFSPQIITIFIRDAEVIEAGSDYLRILGISFIFFCISQILIASMRSVETAKIGLYISILALVTNVILNYVMIFGHFGFPAMGVKGAALATLISRILEAATIVVYVIVVDKKLNFKLADLLKTDKTLLKDFIRYGLPVIGGQLVWSVNMIMNSILLGHMGKEVTAATSMVMILHNLVYVWLNGLASSVGIITGKTVGAGKYELMKKYARIVQVMFFFVGIASGLIIFALKTPFISLYNISPETQAYARQFVNVLSITAAGTSYQMACLFGLVKSGGDVSFVFKMDTIFVFLVVLPSAFIAYFLGAPPWVVFACLKCDQILKCIVAVVKINSFNWMKNLTRESEKENAETAKST